MRILLAPDKFKSTLTAVEFCVHAKQVLEEQGHIVDVCPLADGGEGTAELLTEVSGGVWHQATVHDPLMRPVLAGYGISGDGATAFVDLASASGLWRLKAEEYDPERTTTFGTGELLLDAFSHGVREVILGCGGSATNDGGTGMAAALGFRFFDDRGIELSAITSQMARIRSIDSSGSRLPDGVRIRVISDVTHVLSGPDGAAHVFGPQKGADAAMVKRLDDGLHALGRVFHAHSGQEVAMIPGAGAGGGFTAGSIFFLGASAEGGVQTVMAYSRFAERMQQADLVITGEGRLDDQSLRGKVVTGVAGWCRAFGKPFWVICGENRLNREEEGRLAAWKISSLTDQAGSAAEAQRDPACWLRQILSDPQLPD